jgi:cation:H+ antiporter
LVSCDLFTNGIEWVGKQLRLSQSAVGSVLAAVGTALPETMIPVVAILLKGGEAGHEVGIGAILGAPFMLGTLAFGMVGVSAIGYARARATGHDVVLRRSVILRDMRYFLLVYAFAVTWALRPQALAEHDYLKWLVALVLCAAYYRYVSVYIRRPGDMDEMELRPLRFASRAAEPPLWSAALQVLVALGGILLGARVFVDGIEALAPVLGIGPGVLALIIAPVATELPEKFNSVIWMRASRDTLALGNITGAMVFQSCIPPAIGICCTAWCFTPIAQHVPSLASVAAALLSSAMLMLWAMRRERVSGHAFLGAVTLYVAFILVLIACWRGALPLQAR